MRTLQHTYFGLRFQVKLSAVTEDEASTARWRLQSKAVELIEKDLKNVPGWLVKVDDNGPTTNPDAMEIERAELCENDDEGEVVDGQHTCAVWFYIDGDFPVELAKNLKEFCTAKFQEAAGDLDIRFLRTERNQQFNETERDIWAEV